MYIAFFSGLGPADTERHYLTAARGHKLSAAYTTDESKATQFETEQEGDAECRKRIDRGALPFKKRTRAFGFCCFIPPFHTAEGVTA